MDKYRANRMAMRSGYGDRGPFGKTIVEEHSWRRGRDRGKRRLTHGIYGTKTQVMEALTKDTITTTDLRWNEFRNGKFMVW